MRTQKKDKRFAEQNQLTRDLLSKEWNRCKAISKKQGIRCKRESVLCGLCPLHFKGNQ